MPPAPLLFLLVQLCPAVTSVNRRVIRGLNSRLRNLCAQVLELRQRQKGTIRRLGRAVGDHERVDEAAQQPRGVVVFNHRHDRKLIQEVRPRAIIGDYRLSLSVSARLERLPYATICDAYWSPETPLAPILPVFPWTQFAPLGLSQALFRHVAPLAFRIHARPMERLRRSYGLSGFVGDLR